MYHFSYNVGDYFLDMYDSDKVQILIKAQLTGNELLIGKRGMQDNKLQMPNSLYERNKLC